MVVVRATVLLVVVGFTVDVVVGGNVPRRLRGLILAGEAPAGATLRADGKDVGVVTSVAVSPRLGTVALAYVRRAVEPPADVDVAWEGGATSARVEALPLVP